jgi:hypothetical protein
MKFTLIQPLLAVATLALIHPLSAEEGAAAQPVDIGAFGSDEPVERADQPVRGVLTFGPKDHVHSSQQHWEQFDWKIDAKRPGSYQVRLTYTLKHATLGVQVKLGEQRLKKMLTASGDPRRVYFGAVTIEQPGKLDFSLYTPASGAGAGFTIQEMAFIPTTETGVVTPAEDGTVILEAKDAITWSETMRYEPKAEKNCLGFWTDPEDFAEWEFEVTKPGKYKVVVSHGCGGGNEGSTVAVKQGDQNLKFTVKDTGGFQKWTDAEVGEIEIKKPGVQRLVIDPENKTKSAVLDVQKVVLKPVS